MPHDRANCSNLSKIERYRFCVEERTPPVAREVHGIAREAVRAPGDESSGLLERDDRGADMPEEGHRPDRDDDSKAGDTDPSVMPRSGYQRSDREVAVEHNDEGERYREPGGRRDSLC